MSLINSAWNQSHDNPSDVVVKNVSASAYHSPTFLRLLEASKSINEKNDCSVVAVSAVTGHSYDSIHTLFRHFGRRNRCGVNFNIVLKVLSHLSVPLIDVSNHYPSSSVRSLAPLLPNPGTFLITSRAHVLAVVDTEVQDWSAMRKLYVRRVYQVADHHDSSVVNTVQKIVDNQPIPLPPKPPLRSPLLSADMVDLSRPTYAVHEVANILVEAEENFPHKHSHIRVQLDPLIRKRVLATFRAKVIAECVTHGINKTTAAVQVGKWCKENT